MADYIFIRRSRNILSSVLHVMFNIALGVGSIIITYLTQSPLLGILLVLLSKWRIFAVRPRYWGVNIKSNLVDLILGMSFVFIAYCAGDTFLPIHVILAVAYSLWLVVLKPQSSEIATEIQALVSMFIGTTAAVLLTANANSVFIILPCFLIGYSTIRHILVQRDDHDFGLIPMVIGLVSAEIAWLYQSWLIVYSFTDLGLIIPQLSIILTLLTFVFIVAYKSILNHDGKMEPSEVVMPTMFAIILIAILVIWFSVPIFNI